MNSSSTANSLVMTGNNGNAEMNNGGKPGAVTTDLVAKNNKATTNKELQQMGDGMQQDGLLLGLGLMASSLLLATKKKKANK